MTPYHKHPWTIRNTLKRIIQPLIKEDELNREPGVWVGNPSFLLNLGLCIVVGDVIDEDHVC